MTLGGIPPRVDESARCAGFAIRRGDNEKRPGIGAVRARVVEIARNLLTEAQG